MTLGSHIADQLDRAVFGDAWHGPALMQVLQDVSPAAAHERPMAAAHSIHELAAHTASWLEIVRLRIEKRPPAVTDEMDWSTALTPAGWPATCERVGAAARALAATLRSQGDRAFDEPLPADGTTWTMYQTAQGAIEHTLYHTGQIAIVKKGLAAG